MDTEHRSESAYSIGSDKNLVSIKSRSTLFKRRKKDSGKLIVILAFLAASLLITVIVLSVLYARTSWGSNLCDSEDCVRIAASLKESMDTTVDPCDDFYKYACGRWSIEHPTPDFSLTNSWFSERSDRVSRTIRDLLRKNVTDDIPWAVGQAKTLYASCVSSESINALGLWPLQNLLDELGLPQTPLMLNGEPGNFIDQLGRVKKILGRDVFFGMDIYPDPRNKTRNIVILGPPTTSSPLPSDKELDKRLQRAKARLRNLADDDAEEDEPPLSAEIIYMTDVIREVISNGTAESCVSDNSMIPDEAEIKMAVESIYRMSAEIYYLSRADTNDTSSDEDLKDEDYMLVDDLQKIVDDYINEVNDTLIPRKIWRPFLEAVLNDVTDLDLGNKDKVLVGDLDYLKGVALLLAAADDKTLEIVIWWIAVDIAVPHSSENLRKAWATYLASVTDVEITESRSLQCATAVNQLMGMAVSWLFVSPSFHEDHGPKVREMLEDIRAAFAALVDQADWMDGQTKAATLVKSERMASVIGHPKWLFKDGEIDEYYEGLNMTVDTYLDNMLQLVRLRSAYELASLHVVNAANETYWATDPTDVNAFHTFQANQITVPAGILQFPFYELGLEALNYGAIGTVLGHELTHGFDNSGRQYDSIGNLRQWWTNETISEYTEKTQCFVQHYNSYYEEEVDDYVDGDLTLGENIADNGGLREAVVAYRRRVARHGQEPLLTGFTHLSHEQLLFLGFAHLWCESYTASSLKWMLLDSHCPGHVRLQGVLKNSHEFSEAWKCPVGSNMNPEKKCRLW